MSMSLRRKMALREQAKSERAVATRLAGLSRAGQVARSTVPVGESDLPVVETLETVVDTAETLPGVIESSDQAGSDAYDAAIRVDEAQAVADGAAADALAAAQAAADAMTKANANVAGIVVEYAVGSQTAAPTTGWSTDVPVWVDGSWIWSRTTTVFASGATEVADPVLTTGPAGSEGAPGDPGRGITGAVTTYQASSSPFTPPTGEWLPTIPGVTAGQHLWTRTVTSYTSGDPTTAYSVAKQGSNGNTGAPGTGVSSLTRFFFLSASQPPAPTVSPPPAPWMTTEPAYTPGSSANLYEVARTVMSTGAFSYGPVSLSAAFTAAKQAFDKANEARFLAEGLYQAIPSVTAPTVSPSGPLKQGDMWFVIGASGTPVAGKFIGVQVWDGAAWVPREMLADSLMVVGPDGVVYVANGKVTAAALAVDALNFKTATGMTLTSGQIIGSDIRTALSGQRMQFDVEGLKAFDASGAEVASLSSELGGFNIVGLLRAGQVDAAVVNVSGTYLGNGELAQRTIPFEDFPLKIRSFAASGDGIPIRRDIQMYARQLLLDVSSVQLATDTEWANISVSGATGFARWRRYLGRVYLRFDLNVTASIANGASLAAFTMPAAAGLPEFTTPFAISGVGVAGYGGQVSTAGIVTIANSSGAGRTRFFGAGDWEPV